MAKKIVILLFLVAMLAGIPLAQEAAVDTTGPPEAIPAPPMNITVTNKPNDAGHGLIIRWGLSPDDGAGVNNIAF